AASSPARRGWARSTLGACSRSRTSTGLPRSFSRSRARVGSSAQGGAALSPLLLLSIGLGIGTFGTLVGAGGGFLLVPLLALLAPRLPTAGTTGVSPRL